MAVKKDDFIEIEYTGRLKEDNAVFDTTIEQVAKDNDVHNPNAEYGPVIICLGEGQIVPGLDEALQGKELGKQTVELPPEKAFGKKDAKLIQMVPLMKFTQHEIKPFPGLQINIDNMLGTVKTVSSGRVLVDFNHPLSGKDLIYEIEIKRVVTDKKEQIDSLLKLLIGVKDAKIEIKDNKAKVELKAQLPPQVAEQLTKKIKDLVKVDVEFAKEGEKKEEPKPEAPKAEEKSEPEAPKEDSSPAQ
ncbi:peptidylprolyl isomerase [Candidatus Woesearchaeota archaeon]|nr:peptidylprolyl isomerase [Candidatus Woesearchaeota archaeon]MBW3005283.1 peptidylprolyl isomerase [Candidatus Woesearchaeota archaeon]